MIFVINVSNVPMGFQGRAIPIYSPRFEKSNAKRLRKNLIWLRNIWLYSI